MLNASCEEMCAEFRRKTTRHWFSYFQIAQKYLKMFLTDSLNLMFDNFGICFLAELSIYSTRASLHKYCVTTSEYRWIGVLANVHL